MRKLLIMGVPTPSPSPAGDLIQIHGNPKVMLAGVLIMMVVGFAILYGIHKDDGRKQGKGDGWK